MSTKPSLEEMISALAKTFMVAHVDDTDAHLAQALVYNAGRLAWRLREQGLDVDQKTSVSDVVTDADRAAELFVSSVLEALRAQDGIVGEEGASRPSESGRVWHIDPVDGTYNFASGSDYWCSALSLSDATGVTLGAVHRPAMGYTWFGGKDFPTTRDGQPVRVQSGGADELCLSTYLHPTSLANPNIRSVWQSVAEEFATVRMLGAGSVDLSGVADGTWGAWMQHSVADWDWLPGKALVEAAGGMTAKLEKGGVEWCIAGNADAVAHIKEKFNG
ncbi:fructose 1,6-bisphosphatase [Corynebacterium phocae]|uniref:Fructose 1,6-bisphosphatase n=1 Tax=Corynebacterium phocae TaxID=161895 RepID=A0A1L7D4K4_9CORY|nr:inositol monophosphatase family protein [Corynebacterium phocae]APT93050.1 fructose 1,6-bisphosphatase [Corynebacterium phocae]KAA8722353.1 inositol monophosphatase family protein [Corynebacterium phocae]